MNGISWRACDLEVSVANLLPYEQQVYRGHRWWTLADLQRTQEAVRPESLAELLVPVLAGGLPDTPVSIR
jgi:hypothetical protein